jgi:hypothetical protein
MSNVINGEILKVIEKIKENINIARYILANIKN